MNRGIRVHQPVSLVVHESANTRQLSYYKCTVDDISDLDHEYEPCICCTFNGKYIYPAIEKMQNMLTVCPFNGKYIYPAIEKMQNMLTVCPFNGKYIYPAIEKMQNMLTVCPN